VTHDLGLHWASIYFLYAELLCTRLSELANESIHWFTLIIGTSLRGELILVEVALSISFGACKWINGCFQPNSANIAGRSVVCSHSNDSVQKVKSHWRARLILKDSSSISAVLMIRGKPKSENGESSRWIAMDTPQDSATGRSHLEKGVGDAVNIVWRIMPLYVR